MADEATGVLTIRLRGVDDGHPELTVYAAEVAHARTEWDRYHNGTQRLPIEIVDTEGASLTVHPADILYLAYMPIVEVDG